MTNLDKLIKEFKDARSAAMTSEYESDANPEAIRNNVGKWMEFEAYAANNSAKLIRIIEVMKMCLEKYENSAFEIKGEVYKVGSKATEALQQTEKIAGEKL